MKSINFKKFLGLKLVDIADGIVGESISFIFENKRGNLIGFKIFPKAVFSCEICTFKKLEKGSVMRNDKRRRIKQ